MDIQKLITLGRMERDIDVNGVNFHVVTPASDEVTKIQTNIDMLVTCITKIDDKQFVTAADKEGLRKVLNGMQGAVIKHLADQTDKLIAEQGKMFGSEDETKK